MTKLIYSTMLACFIVLLLFVVAYSEDSYRALRADNVVVFP